VQSDTTVHIVDDDEAIRQSLTLLLRSVDINVQSYDSAQAFLDVFDATKPGCLLLDIRMPAMSGLELQQELKQRKIQIPVIILTGHADVALAVRAMKAGAMDVIEKPFHDQDLLDSVSKALANSVAILQAQQKQIKFLERASMLSPREQEIMNMYIEGKCGKAIAADLNISPKTVNVHRGHILEKMQVRTMIELVHLAMPNKL